MQVAGQLIQGNVIHEAQPNLFRLDNGCPIQWLLVITLDQLSIPAWIFPRSVSYQFGTPEVIWKHIRESKYLLWWVKSYWKDKNKGNSLLKFALFLPFSTTDSYVPWNFCPRWTSHGNCSPQTVNFGSPPTRRFHCSAWKRLIWYRTCSTNESGCGQFRVYRFVNNGNGGRSTGFSL